MGCFLFKCGLSNSKHICLWRLTVNSWSLEFWFEYSLATSRFYQCLVHRPNNRSISFMHFQTSVSSTKRAHLFGASPRPSTALFNWFNSDKACSISIWPAKPPFGKNKPHSKRKFTTAPNIISTASRSTSFLL